MVSSPIRHCENDDAGARLTYEAIDFDDAAQRDWLVADLRRAADDPGTERPQWWIEAPHHAADDVAAAAGWERVRSLVQLRRPLPLDPPPQVTGLRTFDADRDIDAWLALNNEAFAWHPDQGYQNRAGLAIELAAPWVDLEGFFVVDAGQADGTAAGDNPESGVTGGLDGFCWTKFHPADGDDPSLGEVYVIATAARARGRGMGRALVEVGMDHQHRVRGAEVAMLWTEADNEAALGLYEAMGYAIHHTNVAYAPVPDR